MISFAEPQNRESDVLTEKRTGRLPVPEDLDEYLNDMQLGTLHKIEEFGWHLWFIRRPMFQSVLPVLVDAENHATAILEEDGRITKDHNLVTRP